MNCCQISMIKQVNYFCFYFEILIKHHLLTETHISFIKYIAPKFLKQKVFTRFLRILQLRVLSRL